MEPRASWEVAKENIQPLSSGRRMSMLTPSLESSFQQEVNINQKLRELEEKISVYNGDDPLSVWNNIISQIEQNCPSGGKAKLEDLLAKCVKTFFQHEKYRNDRRFIEILIKSMGNYTTERRMSVLKQCLNIGLGVKVSRMYITIADEYMATANYEAALDIIKTGITQEAEPLPILEENFVKIQWAIVSKMASEKDSNKNSEGQRQFGMTVPIVEKNEALSIRNALSPSNPMDSKPLPRTEVKRVQIYQPTSNENDENTQYEPKEHPVNPYDNDEENEMRATRWNARGQVLQDQRPVHPRIIEIYEEEVNSPQRGERATTRPQTLPREGILQEKPPPELPDSPVPIMERKPIVVPQKEPSPEQKPIIQPAKPVENVVSESVQQKPIEKIPGIEQKKPTKRWLPPVNENNQRIMYRKEQLLRGGKELSFEQLRAEVYRKMKQPTSSEDCRVNTMRGSGKGAQIKQESGPSSSVAAFELNEIRSRLEEMEKKLAESAKEKEEFVKREVEMRNEIEKIQKISEIREYEMNSELNRISKVAEGLEKENYGLKTQVNLFTNRIQELEAEREEAANKIKLQEMLNNYSSTSGANTNTLPPNAARRLAFTLYESQVESSRLRSFIDENENGNRGASQEEIAMGVRPIDSMPNRPVPEKEIPEEDKENAMGIQEVVFEKPKRTFSGILQPAVTAEPQEMVFRMDDEEMEEEEDDIIVKGQDQMDFNVSNLTRALAFNPKPLQNSTPDRPIDYTSHFRRPTSQQTPYHPAATSAFEFGTGASAGETPGDNLGGAGSSARQMYNPRLSYTYHQPIPQNLSTIQETSKENRTTSTTGSSSSSASSRGFSSSSITHFAGNFVFPRSVPRPGAGNFPNPQHP